MTALRRLARWGMVGLALANSVLASTDAHGQPPREEARQLQRLRGEDARISFDGPRQNNAALALSGDYRIDALLSFYQWTMDTVTYSFYEDSVFGGAYYGGETVSEVSEAVKTNVRAIMAWYGTLINVNFVEVTETSTTIGRIRIMRSNGPAYAYAYYPYSATLFSQSGDVHLNPSYDRLGDTNGFQHPAGEHGYVSLIHEIGHAIGLKHPHDGSPNLPSGEDNHSHTVMSYGFLGESPGTPMGYDLLALQYMYGARARRTGDDAYLFTRSAVDQYSVGGQLVIDPSLTTKQTIWDSGGYNALDLSSITPAASGYRLDLNPLGWLSTNANYISTTSTYLFAGTVIGPTVAIRQIVNSSGNDTIIANTLPNVFSGYAANRFTGTDVILGASSDDTIDLSGYSPGEVVQTPSGYDLVLGLGSNGSLRIKDYFLNYPTLLFTGVVTADLVTPNSGTGGGQTFALRFSDSNGAARLSTAWVWFNATFATSAAGSCLVYYDAAANRVKLLDDTGGVWLDAALGSGGTIQNSQCAVAAGISSVATGDTTMTLTLAMTFKPPFAGVKNIYMFANDSGGAESGWQDRGDWTVPAISVVTADSSSPAAGSGSSQTFSLQYSDSLGASDLTTTWVWFNATFANSAAGSCLIHYNRATNTLFLLNDAGTTWNPATLGTAGTLENSQCGIAVGNSGVSSIGNTLTVTLTMMFKPAFAGGKNIYLYAGGLGAASGWRDVGDWTVPGGGPLSVTADSSTPSAGNGAEQSFALQYSSSLGAADLSTTWVWFNATFAPSAASSCLVYADRAANIVYLLNDLGTTWMPGILGGGGTLENSQCAIALGSSSTSMTGNTLTVTVAMTFTPAFAGAKNIYMYGTNGGVNSGWQDRGDWTVP